MDLEQFGSLARARRTNRLVDEREVPAELIDELCALATWAPNHKRTWPWRFAALTGAARAELGEAFAADMTARGETGDERLAATRAKYTRTPNVLVVATAADASLLLHAENALAVAAGIQNVLLGATAAGLASFWGSPPVADGPESLALCGFEPTDRIVAVVYLGWERDAVDAPPRPAPQVRHLS